jgi:hypothetical protein
VGQRSLGTKLWEGLDPTANPPKPKAPDGSPRSIIQLGSLEKVAQWAGSGFVLLAGLGSAFGISQGPLDRMVGAYPRQSLLVAVFIGGAIVLSLLAGTLTPEAVKEQDDSSPSTAPQGTKNTQKEPNIGDRDSAPHVRATWLLLAAFLLTVLIAVLFPNMPSERWPLWHTVLAIAAAALIVLLLVYLPLRRLGLVLPLDAAGMVVAVTLLSLGLYGAAKLIVVTRMPSQHGAINTTVTATDRGDQLSVTVALAGFVPVDGRARLEVGSGDWKQERELFADAVGFVEETEDFLLPDLGSDIQIALHRCGEEPGNTILRQVQQFLRERREAESDASGQDDDAGDASDEDSDCQPLQRRTVQFHSGAPRSVTVTIALGEEGTPVVDVDGSGVMPPGSAWLCVSAKLDGIDDGLQRLLSAPLSVSTTGNIAGVFSLPQVPGPAELVATVRDNDSCPVDGSSGLEPGRGEPTAYLYLSPPTAEVDAVDATDEDDS